LLRYTLYIPDHALISIASIKTPVPRLLFDVAVTVHRTLGTDQPFEANVLIDEWMMSTISWAPTRKSIAIDSCTLDAKFAAAIMHQLVLFLDGVFHLPLAQRILDVCNYLQTVVDTRERVTGLSDECRMAAITDSLQCIARIVGHGALFGRDCYMGPKS
jgi:hypothetical protein